MNVYYSLINKYMYVCSYVLYILAYVLRNILTLTFVVVFVVHLPAAVVVDFYYSYKLKFDVSRSSSLYYLC